MDLGRVWYAAYGSNLLEARFLTYLRGGRAPGAQRDQFGARDRSDPLDDRPIMLDRALVFGQSAALWGGGGVCFLDGSAEGSVAATPTYGRAWLLTIEQLEDVWAQENGSARVEATTAESIDIEALASAGFVDAAHRGWYRRLLYLGKLDGYPVATITSDELPELNPSGPDYLLVVGRGLVDTWGLSPNEAAHYLATRPGNAGSVDEAELVARLDQTP